MKTPRNSKFFDAFALRGCVFDFVDLKTLGVRLLAIG